MDSTEEKRRKSAFVYILLCMCYTRVCLTYRRVYIIRSLTVPWFLWRKNKDKKKTRNIIIKSKKENRRGSEDETEQTKYIERSFKKEGVKGQCCFRYHTEARGDYNKKGEEDEKKKKR
jgi:hypothetical protein